jgi:hypothetical protein
MTIGLSMNAKQIKCLVVSTTNQGKRILPRQQGPYRQSGKVVLSAVN